MMGMNRHSKRARNRDELLDRARNLGRGGNYRRRRGLSGTMIMGGILSVAAAGLVYRYLARHHDKRLPFSARQRAVHLNGSVNINKPAEEIYQFWRRFVDLPKVMTFLERVENKGGDVTHWVARGPLATRVQWDSEVTEDVPNGRIAWHSLEGSDVKTWGDVKFMAKSHGSGTDVIVNLYFQPPGSLPGATVARFLKGLENALLEQNLRNLKSYLEADEATQGQWRTHHSHSSRPSA